MLIAARLRLWTLLAVALYLILSAMLLIHQPGLQYDKAMLIAGSVRMLHSEEPFSLNHRPDMWLCHHSNCLPLMGAGQRYVGALKDYLALPLFAAFGTHTRLIRVLSALLGALGIWRLAEFLSFWITKGVGAAFALALAINPAYIKMTVFDNSAFPVRWAGLDCCFRILPSICVIAVRRQHS